MYVKKLKSGGGLDNLVEKKEKSIEKINENRTCYQTTKHDNLSMVKILIITRQIINLNKSLILSISYKKDIIS